MLVSPSAHRPPITSPTHAIPSPPTPLIGRTEAVGDALEMLTDASQSVRWVTLTGPGGIGKTRLAIEIATRAAHHPDSPFPDGIWFVDLIPVASPEAVIPAICLRVLGSGCGAQQPQTALPDAIGDGRALLVLDNGEHLVEAAGAVDVLLDRCPHLSVLLTSREAWHLRREYVREITPLALPVAMAQVPWTQQALLEAPATRLFVERAQASGGFTLTEKNADSIVTLCRWLEGNPLAIELAAARSRFLDPTALMAMTDERLAQLSWPAADLPVRHRSLTAQIDWSVDLLTVAERLVFARLSVFVSGFDRLAAHAVAASAGDDSLQILATLVERHLVQRVPNGAEPARFRLLETVRDYGTHLLERIGDAAATRDRHLAYYLMQAEHATRDFHTSAWQHWTQQLSADHDNLRSAIRWTIATGAIETEIRLNLALQLFWVAHGHIQEALHHLQDMDARIPADMDARIHHRILMEMGTIATWTRQGFDAADSFQRGLALAETFGDRVEIARAQCWLSVAAYQLGDIERARALSRDAIATAHTINAWVEVGFAYRNLTFIALFSEAPDDERRQLATELDETIRYLRQHDNVRNVAMLLVGQARLIPDLPPSELLSRLRESLVLADRVQDQMVIEFVVWSAAYLLRDRLLPAGVAELVGLVEGTYVWIQRHGNFGLMSSFGDPMAETALRSAAADAQQSLGGDRFRAIVRTRNDFPLDRIPQAMIRLVESIASGNLDETVHFTLVPEPSPSLTSTLSRRERQVLALLAQGMSNKEMGKALSLSDRTVERHIASIYRKLDVHRRGDAAAFAERHGLT